MTGGIAQVFSGPEAAGRRRWKRHPPTGDEVAAVAVVTVSQSDPWTTRGRAAVQR